MKLSSLLLVLSASSLLLLACDDKAKPAGGANGSGSAGAASAARAPDVVATPSGSTKGAAAEKKAKPTAEAGEALLKGWLKAQNDGDFDAYAKLYDASFKGVRRSDSGAEKTMDLAGWKADREKMFKKKQTVAADDLKVAVDGEAVELSFTQRWKSGAYADHGAKVLRARAGEDGALRIVSEELKASESGWEDSKVAAFDATTLVSPVTVRAEVKRLPKPEMGDCQGSTLVVRLTDAKGTTRSFDYGSVTGMAEGNATPVGVVKPTKGELSVPGQWCAGLQQGYVLKGAKDALVAIETWKDEESGGARAAKVIAKLPAGGEIVIK